MLFLVGCVTTVTSVTTPSPYADIAPQPVPQKFDCSITGDNAAFTMACTEPVPTATATPTPSVYYLFCEVGDALCWGTPWRVWWDPGQLHLRCAVNVTPDTNGAKVTVLSQMEPSRFTNDKRLAWVVTGWMSGSEPCAGWIEADRLRAAQ